MKSEKIIYESGITVWVCDDMFHREEGPAIDYPNGDKIYMQYDNPHRLDGPAYVYHNSIYNRYYLNGKMINVKSDKEYFQYQKLIAFQ
jgi:hypothetical protein